MLLVFNCLDSFPIVIAIQNNIHKRSYAGILLHARSYTLLNTAVMYLH